MAKAKLIHRERGEGFPFHQEQFPRNQLDDVPTDIPVGERACSPHAGVNIHNGYTLRANTVEIPPYSPASPCGVCPGGTSTGVASGNGMLHPAGHRDEDEDGDGDAPAAGHVPVEIPVGNNHRPCWSHCKRHGARWPQPVGRCQQPLGAGAAVRGAAGYACAGGGCSLPPAAFVLSAPEKRKLECFYSYQLHTPTFSGA